MADRPRGEHDVHASDERLDDVALEALAEAYATVPPAGLRERVLARARVEKRDARTRRALARWRLVGAVAAGVVLVLAGALLREGRRAALRGAELAGLARSNAELAAAVTERERRLVGLQEALDAQAEALRVVGGPATVMATLAPQGGVAGGGRVLVDTATGGVAVVVAGLAPPGEGKTYELWAIRGEAVPEPAGLFAVAGGETVAARLAPLPRPREVTAFAVSIEPAGGSAQPTGPVVLVGAVAG